MYELTRNPDIAARLREEILNQVGPTRRPDYDDIKEMKYVRAFINGKLLHRLSVSFAHSRIRGSTAVPTSVSTLVLGM